MTGLAENVTILMPKKKVGSQAASAEKKKLRVAAYARVSTDNEEQEGSYEIQVEYYTTLIKNNPDWEFAGVYADDGISGTYTAKRGGFMQMIEDCRARKIDMILTKSISRFARNTVDCLNFTRELKELNIAVRFEKENINTLDASGEVLLTIMRHWPSRNPSRFPRTSVSALSSETNKARCRSTTIAFWDIRRTKTAT